MMHSGNFHIAKLIKDLKTEKLRVGIELRRNRICYMIDKIARDEALKNQQVDAANQEIIMPKTGDRK